MTAASESDLEKMKYRLNLILIALLCSTTLAPCVIFYVRGAGELMWLVVFAVISYLVSRLPEAFYNRLQISTDLNVYRRLKVDLFKRLSTNGDLINKRIRRKYPAYRNVQSMESIKEKLQETYSIERSHTVLYVFCLLTTVYAFLVHSFITATILFIGNLLFNYYPNLLQQYNRIRYRRVVENYD